MRNLINRFVFVGLAAALWSGAVANGKLTGLTHRKVGQGVQVLIKGTELPKPSIVRSNGNRAYILEFRDTSLVGKSVRTRVHYSGVQYAYAGWFSSRPPVVRVQVILQKHLNPELAQVPGGWTVCFNTPIPEDVVDTTALKAVNVETTAVAANFPTMVPSIEPKKTEVVPVQNTNDKKIADYSEQTVKPKKSRVTYSKKVAVKEKPPVVTHRNKLIDLNCNDTEIVQILKFLADQSRVNIVTGPEVQGKINVTLNQVELTQALDYVTTLARLRYAKVGNTYVVTSNARFAEAMQQLAGKLEDPGETRVVRLTSGEGVQIKAAVFKALPQFTSKGSYDIILPTEEILVGSVSGAALIEGSGAASGSGKASESSGKTGGASSGGGTGDKDQKAGGAAATEATGTAEANASNVRITAKSKDPGKDSKDAYLLVVGSPDRVDEIVGFINALDKEVAIAANVGPNRDVTTRVIPVYSGHMERITEALQAIIDRDSRKAAFKITNNITVEKETTSVNTASGPTETLTESKKVPKTPLVFLTGPKDSLEGLVDIANTLDKGICDALGMPYTKDMNATRSYAVLGLNNISPEQAMYFLNTHIPRLSADAMPSGAGSTLAGSSTSGGTTSGAGSGQTSGTGTGASTGATGGTTGTTATNNTAPTSSDGSNPLQLLVYGTHEEIVAAQNLISTIDLPAKQVAIEMRVMELSREEALKVGLDWSLLSGGTLRTIRINQGLGNTSGTAGTISSGSSTSIPDITDKSTVPNQGLNLGDSTFMNILGTLDQIADKNHLISRPNILATDGRLSNLFIGDTVRYVESVQSTQNGTTVTTSSVDVGVSFDVRPRVGANNNITLDLAPKFTLLKGFTSVPGGGQIPQTSERRASSTMTVRDGETIAIGGLIQDQDINNVGGIPFLKDIPIIGYLFKRVERTKVRKEIVFFLTVKVVDNTTKFTAAHPRSNDDLKLPEPPASKNRK